jgi:hypothetical protein
MRCYGARVRMALSWRNLSCALKADIGIGKRAFGGLGQSARATGAAARPSGKAPGVGTTGSGRDILVAWEGQMTIWLRRRDFIAGLGGAAGSRSVSFAEPVGLWATPLRCPHVHRLASRLSQHTVGCALAASGQAVSLLLQSSRCGDSRDRSERSSAKERRDRSERETRQRLVRR